jgi:phage/plasmid-like protein (TIGR03299 family)
MNTQNFADSLIISAIQNDKVNELLDKFGLNWEVEKTPLILPNGSETPYFALVRSDNGQCLNSVKDSYVPFQNSELADLVIKIADKGGYNIHSGGKFNGGQKLYLQLESGNEIKSIGENRSKVIGYISGINSHDGTTSLKWGNVNFTICCRNTFAAATKQLQNSAKHTQSIHAKVEEYLQQIGLIIKQETAIFDQFIKMSETPVTKQLIQQVVKEITKVDTALTPAQAKEQYTTYQINRTNELLTSIASETNAKGQTRWGLFSGVTHYTSHVMPVPNREAARIESKYTGTALSTDNTIFKMLSIN